VELVLAMERFVCDSAPEPEVVIAGTVLYCLHARMRFGDLVRMEKEPILDVFEDVGFLQGSILHQKTAGPTPSLPLPVVALAEGVSGSPWARRWLEARLACGVSACRRTGLVPMVGMGGWIERRMRTQEAGCWIREFAQALTPLPVEVTSSLGASSLKPTLLSWAAKFGMDAGSRRLLGYHVKPKDKSVRIYSRDALAGPLRGLRDVLSAVRGGDFLPDADRSGRFRAKPAASPPPRVDTSPAAEAPELPCDVEVADSVARSSSDPGPRAAPPSDDGASSSSSSSVSSTSSPVELGIEVLYVLNLRGKIVHVESGDGILSCGRPYPRAFSIGREMPASAVACRRCFKGQA
jgi:hypothetical protein